MTPGIVVVGSINQDVALHVIRAPSPGETVLASAQTVSFGGKGANQAIAAIRSIPPARSSPALETARPDAGSLRTAALHAGPPQAEPHQAAAVTFVGVVGNDPAGHAARRNLADAGIDVSSVRMCDQATGAAYVTVATTGENSIVVVPGANAELTPADIDRAADVLDAATVVVLQLEIPLPVVERAADAVGTVILNAAPARPLPPALLAKIDVLIVNEGEAAALLEGDASDDVDVLTRQLHALGPASVVVTLGKRGAVWRTAHAAGSVPAPPVDVVDTTGAGDAFIGAFAAACLLAAESASPDGSSTDGPSTDGPSTDGPSTDESSADPPGTNLTTNPVRRRPATVDMAACVQAGVRLASAATMVRGAQVPAQLIADR